MFSKVFMTVMMIMQFLAGILCGKYIMDSFKDSIYKSNYIPASFYNLIEANKAFEILFSVFILCVMLLLLISVLYFQIIIHESGHLVFGLLSGYRFSSFRYWNYVIVKDGERLKLKRYSLEGTGGQCLMVPPELEDGKVPYFLYNIGGALMDMISALLFLAAYFIVDNAFLKSFALLLVISGVTNSLINGVPLITNDIDNDGMNILQIRKSEEALRSYWNQLKIAELTLGGARMRDIPDELLEISSKESLYNSMNATIAVFKCDKMLDEHRFSEAKPMIKELLESDYRIEGVLKNNLKCNLLFIELISDNNAETVEAIVDKRMEKILKKPSSSITVLRTQYAYALIYEHDVQRANKIKASFDKIVSAYPYEGDAKSETECIDIINSISAKR